MRGCRSVPPTPPPRLVLADTGAVLAVLFFGGPFDRDEERDLNLDVAPDVNVNLPDTQLPPPPVILVPEGQAPPPDVNVNVTTPPPESAENLSDTNTVVENSG